MNYQLQDTKDPIYRNHPLLMQIIELIENSQELLFNLF